MITSGIIFPVYSQSSDSQDPSDYKEKLIISGQVAIGDFTWTPQNFAGFYYDLDSDTGTEMLSTTLVDGKLSGSYPYGLTYRTTAQEVPFRFQEWGSYSALGFLGKKCFAGYLEGSDPDKNLLFKESESGNSLALGQLEEVLLDDDTETTITSSSPLMLEEGYSLSLKSVNATEGRAFVELFQGGEIIDRKVIPLLKENAPLSDQTYCYKADAGNQKGLVVIAVHFKNAFSSVDQDLATVDGIFQISEQPISVRPDTAFEKMTISEATGERIAMDNRGSTITLSKNRDALLAWDLHLQTSDQSTVDNTQPLRYYPYREIETPGEYEIRGSAATGDYTWNTQNFAGFYYDLNNDAGTEALSASLGDCQSVGKCPCEFSYDTYAQEIPFRFQDWGSYDVIGFLGKKCFAGYPESSESSQGLFKKPTELSPVAGAQLEEVLLDDNAEMTITTRSPMMLKEGYELEIGAVDSIGERTYIQLRKDGQIIDGKQLNLSSDSTILDKTFIYKSTVGNQKNLIIIAAHFKNAFAAADSNIATVDGIWQISDQPIAVQEGSNFDKMTVQAVEHPELHINMNNRDHEITLSKNKNTQLMGDLGIRTANSDSLRFFVYKKELVKALGIPGAEIGQEPGLGEVIPTGPSEIKPPEKTKSPATQAGSSSRQVGTDSVLVMTPESLIQTADWGEVPANQVIVVLKDGRGRGDADRIAASLGGRVVGAFGYLNLYQIETQGKTEVDLRSAIDKASLDQDVELAFPNQQNVDDMTLQGVECSPLDDPAYTEKGRGKGYEMIGVQKAWDVMRASGLQLSKVAVGVVDDGLFKGNDEFQGKTRIDTSDPDSELANPKDQFGSHGTRIMNIIAANPDNGGVTGIASQPLQDKLTVSMVNKNAFGNNAMGDLLALNESVNKGNKIISCSWGNTHADPNTVKAFKSFFEKMARDHPDVLFVCSAGNDGEVVDGNRRFPSGLNLPNMITVGNVMNDGSKAAGQRDADGLETSKSNMASANFEVTLAAPGEQAVKGFDNQGNLQNNNGGTSMATPQVAAAAALIGALNPKLNAREIKGILAETARTTLDIDGKKVAAPPELGGRILAIDEAVLKVINDLRAEKRLGPLSMEEAIGRARVGLVARNDSASPQEWKVTAEILSMGDAGTDVTIELQGEGSVGDDSKRHLSQPGNLVWDVTAKGSATVVVKRLDTMGCSRVVLPELALPAQGFSGKWQLWSIIGGSKIPFCGGIKCSYVLSQSGSSVTLTPPEFFKSQTIVGTINGNTFTGTLRNDDPNTPPSSPFKYGQTHGNVEITFSPDGTNFTGRMMDENWGSELEWEGEKIQETQP